MYQKFIDFVQDKKRICVIQAENPDGDSLGSAIALDYLLKDAEVSMYCPIDIPKYLHYFADWSRIENLFDYRADGYIIVDTAATVLLSKLLEDSAIRNRLYTAPVLVIDHHETEDDLDFEHESIIEVRPACAELIYEIAANQNLEITKPAAEALMQGILSDTLGLTSASVTARTFEIMSELTKLGANVSELEENRREFMKKSPRILDYKADLIKRVEYSLDGALATVHIPWEDIREFSDEYNPNVLILEELRLVEGVKVAVAIKRGKVSARCTTDLVGFLAVNLGPHAGDGRGQLSGGDVVCRGR